MNHKVQLALAFSMLLRAGVTAQNHTVAVAEVYNLKRANTAATV